MSYAELLAGAAAGHHEVQMVRGFFEELIEDLVPVDRQIAERAAVLRGAKARLLLPDALILATAEESGADLVLGADAGWAGIPGYACKVELLRAVSG